MLAAVLKRELLLWARQRADLVQLWAMPALLAYLLCFLDNIGQIPPTLLLIIVLLWPVYILVTRCWADDAQSGALEQIALSRVPLWLMAGLRIATITEIVFWPAALLTMLVLMLVGGAQFGWLDVLSVFLAGYVLAALASTIAALTVAIPSQPALPLLIIIPLLLPVLVVLGAALMMPDVAVAARYLLGALALVSVPLGAIATAAALRQQLSD